MYSTCDVFGFSFCDCLLFLSSTFTLHLFTLLYTLLHKLPLWNNAQNPDGEKHDLYDAHFTKLSGALPELISTIIQQTIEGLNQTLNHMPWALTHQDLSDMTILVDPDSGHLTGVIDWVYVY